MTLSLIAGPGEEPVSLADAKAWLRLDAGDEDALVEALVAAARLHIESLTGRALVTQTWRVTLACAPKLVVLPVVPVASLIDAPDGAVLQGDAVLLPAAGDDISIEFNAGYGGADDVPQDLKQSVLLLVAYWFENRDTSAVTTPAALGRLLAGYSRVRL